MDHGCRLSTYDARDYKLKCSGVQQVIPESFSCNIKNAVKNQKQVSSCVAHALSSILEYHSIPNRKLSTNFIYGIQKELFDRDNKGMYLRDACQIALDYGDMLYDDCPGNTEVPECHDQASSALHEEEKAERAYKYHVQKYFSCSTNDEIKQAIYHYGPVLASIKWYDNYHTNLQGTLVGKEQGDFGYHAVMVYGYTPEGFWCQNSWGKLWGKGGRFFVPNSIKFREVRGFVDYDGDETEDIIEPKRNKLLNIFYKIVNLIVNMFKKK